MLLGEAATGYGYELIEEGANESMKLHILSVICFLLGTALALRPPSEVPQDRGETSEILVSDGKSGCPGADFYSIQDAVNAAQSGDTVHICQGEYTEQVVVQKPIKLLADIGVVLTPEHMVQNASSLTTGEPFAAAILVSDADGVDVTGFVLNTRDNRIAGCTPRLIGILYQNASGEIVSNAVSHVRLPGTLSTCHSGNAIEVQSGSGGHSKVDIHDNSVDDYQINAITANGKGTDVGIDENEITTSNPLEGVSWNGIEVAFGASGVVENNTIAADLLPGSPRSRCPSNTVGILVFKSDGVYVASNSVESTQMGILVVGNRSKVIGNHFPACSPVQGIAVLGDANEVTDNELPSSAEAAIFIRGEKNRIQRNRLPQGSLGILEIKSSSDNVVSDKSLVAPYVPSPQLSW